MTSSIAGTGSQRQQVPLVEWLIKLEEKDDRCALAALRSGLGKPPGAAPRMFPIVAPFLTSNEDAGTKSTFLTAALFARHPAPKGTGSLGAALWRSTMSDRNPSAKLRAPGVEARFAAALDSDPEDLPRHLDGLVSLCESAGEPIDWTSFFWDVRDLLGTAEDKVVKTRIRWARDFWGGPLSAKQSEEPKEEI